MLFQVKTAPGELKSICLIEEETSTRSSKTQNALHISYKNLNQNEKLQTKKRDAGAHFSISRYSIQELTAALHEEGLPAIQKEDDRVLYLHIDCAHMGVGGDNSWSPATLPEYFVPPQEEWEYSITLRQIAV